MQIGDEQRGLPRAQSPSVRGRLRQNSPGYQGEAVVGGPRHLAAFGSGLEHLGPERGAVHGDLPDGDDQLTVQGHQRVELLDDLRR